jgi:hypothetical protein
MCRGSTDGNKETLQFLKIVKQIICPQNDKIIKEPKTHETKPRVLVEGKTNKFGKRKCDTTIKNAHYIVSVQ